ncbi:hypothetical protein [Paracoccus shanxieyensis]|uniref:Uncharacterized protein n=1 Tax=Paracoccus shanxieyensis TaxID=2675752 RepID=A0A6L6J3I5_9RHOB|nr:hypothetical protein [Paracoccus shanxieyensis]MTH66749.1 hypothetical protein [Paracoccus shanxieyensis]MTH89987.1 hypothetical protein [Paracoccus shanxieyensis]
MPLLTIGQTWSDPIELQPRDMVQNHGLFLIELCPNNPLVDAASLRLPPDTGAIEIDQAVRVVARSLGGAGHLSIVRGF